MIIRRVVGHSMEPILLPGCIVVGIKSTKYCIGDIVVVNISGREVIKRITGIKANKYYLKGDNKLQSTDSDEWGWIDSNKLKSKIVLKIGR